MHPSERERVNYLLPAHPGFGSQVLHDSGRAPILINSYPRQMWTKSGNTQAPSIRHMWQWDATVWDWRFLPTVFLVKQHSCSKKGSSVHLLTVKISSVDACFQQLCRFLVWISCVLCPLLSVWLLVSKTGSTRWRVRSLCCLLASWPRALWQIFKSVEVVFTKIIGEKGLIRAVFS